mmetsp:Transcript_11764/g.14755  ORF Transcript_11764/g.14755 Transcript_11764/m.14755 type:complete len:711 (-) Transcript_11764:29-2161(-)
MAVVREGKCLIIANNNKALSMSGGGQLSFSMQKNGYGNEGFIIEKAGGNKLYTIKSVKVWNTYLGGTFQGALKTTKMKMARDCNFIITINNVGKALIVHQASNTALSKNFSQQPCLSRSKNVNGNEGFTIKYLDKPKVIKPKVAVVTGSNNVEALGYAFVRELIVKLPKGSEVYITGRDKQKNEAAKKALETEGYKAFETVLDFTNDKSIAKFVDFIKTIHGKIDVFIHNGNMSPPMGRREQKDGESDDDYKKYNETYYEEIKKFLDTSHFGTVKITQAVYPLLNDYARYVIIASGMSPLRNQPSKDVRDKLRNVEDIDGLNKIVEEYLTDIKNMTDKGKWNNWVNFIGKALQVCVGNIFAKKAAKDSRKGIVFNSVCPGWTLTPKIKQLLDENPNLKPPVVKTPEEAAKDVIPFAIIPEDTRFPKNGGEIYQYGKPLNFFAEPEVKTEEKGEAKAEAKAEAKTDAPTDTPADAPTDATSEAKDAKKDTVADDVYELYYWPSLGGRSNPLRLIMELGKAKYVVKTDYTKFDKIKGANTEYYPNWAVPIIKKGNFVLSQTPAIGGYLAEQLNLLPTNINDKYQAMAVVLLVWDLVAEVVNSDRELATDDAKFDKLWGKENGRFIKILCVVEKQLKQNNGGKGYFFGDKVSYVDCFVCDVMRRLRIFRNDLYNEYPIPLLRDLIKRFEEIDEIKKFYQSDRYAFNKNNKWTY